MEASVRAVDSPGTVAADPVREAVDDLRQRALLWGPDHRLHLVRAVREHFGPYPGALAPPSTRRSPPACATRPRASSPSWCSSRAPARS